MNHIFKYILLLSLFACSDPVTSSKKCEALQTICIGGDVYICQADSQVEFIKECAQGSQCLEGQCVEKTQATDGTDGSDGTDGTDGSSGNTSTTSADGTDGKTTHSDGTDGHSGEAGSDHNHGTDGSDGTDGKDGTDSSDGTDGDDGTDGETGDKTVFKGSCEKHSSAFLSGKVFEHASTCMDKCDAEYEKGALFLKKCIDDCLETNYSAECATCVSDWFVCGEENCDAKCGENFGSKTCDDCNAKFCNPAMKECSGIDMTSLTGEGDRQSDNDDHDH